MVNINYHTMDDASHNKKDAIYKKIISFMTTLDKNKHADGTGEPTPCPL